MKLLDILSLNNILAIQNDSWRKVTILGNIFSVTGHIDFGPILNSCRIMNLRN